MLTPIEIRQQTFNREFRGYDRVEVDAFLEEVSKAFEQQLEINQRLREDLEKVKASYNTLKEVENMLHKTLIQAENSTKTALENARQKAELKVREAEARAREIIQQGVEKRSRTENEIQELAQRREEIFSQLRIFLNTQMDRLDGFEKYKELPAAPAPPPKLNNHNDVFGLNDKASKAPSLNGSSPDKLLEDIADEL